MYLEPLKKTNEFLTIRALTQKVCEMFPNLLENATLQIQRHKNPTTPFKAVYGRIQSEISRGRYQQRIDIDTTCKPMKIRIKSIL